MINFICSRPATSFDLLDAFGKIGPVITAAIVAFVGYMQYRNGKAAAERSAHLAERQHHLDEREFAMQLFDQRRAVVEKLSKLYRSVPELGSDDDLRRDIIDEINVTLRFADPLFPAAVRAKAIELAEAGGKYRVEARGSSSAETGYRARMLFLMNDMIAAMRMSD